MEEMLLRKKDVIYGSNVIKEEVHCVWIEVKLLRKKDVM